MYNAKKVDQVRHFLRKISADSDIIGDSGGSLYLLTGDLCYRRGKGGSNAEFRISNDE